MLINDSQNKKQNRKFNKKYINNSKKAIKKS